MFLSFKPEDLRMGFKDEIDPKHATLIGAKICEHNNLKNMYYNI